MNGFQRHGITHLSASSVNLFVHQPGLWVAERLAKRRGPVGCAAHRGTASEAGIVHGLLNNASMAECQAHALTEYDKLTALSGDPNRDKERAAVPDIVAIGFAELKPYGRPDMVQARVERTIPGVPVPFLGFIDVGWSDHGIIVDIKSQLRLSSEISTDHARQVSIYIHGTNHEGRIAYVTPKKVGVYRVEDAERHIADLVIIAQRMERFLALGDAETLAAAVVVDDSSFYVNNPTSQAMIREFMGMAP